MELRINPYQTPEQISFNYEELKEMLLQKASRYESLVYTDEQIKDAKVDRANLNRLKKALSDERLKREREYMQPFAEFKRQINEIIGIIDSPITMIDGQIKAYEEKQKEEKLEKIKAYWQEFLQLDKIPAGISFNHLFNEKWLNASVSMKSIQDEINTKLEKIVADLTVIENLPAYTFEAQEVYINTLDLAKAVSEAHRLRELAEKKAAWEAEQARLKAEAEAAAIKPNVKTNINDPEDIENIRPAQSEQAEPKKEWIRFQALLSVDEAKALGQYMRDHGIQYKSI